MSPDEPKFVNVFDDWNKDDMSTCRNLCSNAGDSKVWRGHYDYCILYGPANPAYCFGYALDKAAAGGR